MPDPRAEEAPWLPAGLVGRAVLFVLVLAASAAVLRGLKREAIE